jgi:integrase
VPLFSPRASRASCQKHLTTWASLNSLQITCVAHLIAAKQQPLKIAKRLGHASAAFTQDRYGHLFEDADSEAAAAVAAMVDEAL